MRFFKLLPFHNSFAEIPYFFSMESLICIYRRFHVGVQCSTIFQWTLSRFQPRSLVNPMHNFWWDPRALIRRLLIRHGCQKLGPSLQAVDTSPYVFCGCPSQCRSLSHGHTLQLHIPPVVFLFRWVQESLFKYVLLGFGFSDKSRFSISKALNK